MSEITAVKPEQVAELKGETSLVVQRANELAITTQAQNQLAGTELVAIKGLRKKVAETFDPVVKAARASWQTAIDAREKHDNPLADAEALIKTKMARFMAEEDRRRRAEEARLQAEADAKAAEAALLEAEDLKEQGENEAAALMLAAPPPSPVIKIAAPERPKGVSTTRVWHFEVMNPGLVPPRYMSVDEKKIGAEVRSQKEATSIPGVRVWFTDEVRARA